MIPFITVPVPHVRTRFPFVVTQRIQRQVLVLPVTHRSNFSFVSTKTTTTTRIRQRISPTIVTLSSQRFSNQYSNEIQLAPNITIVITIEATNPIPMPMHTITPTHQTTSEEIHLHPSSQQQHHHPSLLTAVSQSPVAPALPPVYLEENKEIRIDTPEVSYLSEVTERIQKELLNSTIRNNTSSSSNHDQQLHSIENAWGIFLNEFTPTCLQEIKNHEKIQHDSNESSTNGSALLISSMQINTIQNEIRELLSELLKVRLRIYEMTQGFVLDTKIMNEIEANQEGNLPPNDKQRKSSVYNPIHVFEFLNELGSIPTSACFSLLLKSMAVDGCPYSCTIRNVENGHYLVNNIRSNSKSSLPYALQPNDVLLYMIQNGTSKQQPTIDTFTCCFMKYELDTLRYSKQQKQERKQKKQNQQQIIGNDTSLQMNGTMIQDTWDLMLSIGFQPTPKTLGYYVSTLWNMKIIGKDQDQNMSEIEQQMMDLFRQYEAILFQDDKCSMKYMLLCIQLQQVDEYPKMHSLIQKVLHENITHLKTVTTMKEKYSSKQSNDPVDDDWYATPPPVVLDNDFWLVSEYFYRVYKQKDRYQEYLEFKKQYTTLSITGTPTPSSSTSSSPVITNTSMELESTITPVVQSSRRTSMDPYLEAKTALFSILSKRKENPIQITEDAWEQFFATYLPAYYSEKDNFTRMNKPSNTLLNDSRKLLTQILELRAECNRKHVGPKQKKRSLSGKNNSVFKHEQVWLSLQELKNIPLTNCFNVMLSSVFEDPHNETLKVNPLDVIRYMTTLKHRCQHPDKYTFNVAFSIYHLAMSKGTGGNIPIIRSVNELWDKMIKYNGSPTNRSLIKFVRILKDIEQYERIIQLFDEYNHQLSACPTSIANWVIACKKLNKIDMYEHVDEVIQNIVKDMIEFYGRNQNDVSNEQINVHSTDGGDVNQKQKYQGPLVRQPTQETYNYFWNVTLIHYKSIGNIVRYEEHLKQKSFLMRLLNDPNSSSDVPSASSNDLVASSEVASTIASSDDPVASSDDPIVNSDVLIASSDDLVASSDDPIASFDVVSIIASSDDPIASSNVISTL